MQRKFRNLFAKNYRGNIYNYCSCWWSIISAVKSVVCINPVIKFSFTLYQRSSKQLLRWWNGDLFHLQNSIQSERSLESGFGVRKDVKDSTSSILYEYNIHDRAIFMFYDDNFQNLQIWRMPMQGATSSSNLQTWTQEARDAISERVQFEIWHGLT